MIVLLVTTGHLQRKEKRSSLVATTEAWMTPFLELEVQGNLLGGASILINAAGAASYILKTQGLVDGSASLTLTKREP